MSITEMEQARHAEDRGEILRALKDDYGSEMTSVRSLTGALSIAGRPMTTQGLQFHLALLADSGYIRIWRAKDMPTWRPDRAAETRADVIVFARLLPRGLQLIDGQAPADPAVRF